MFSPYDDKDHIAAAVREGRHRDVIGGMWDEIGSLQFDFLKNNGLQPDHVLLDIGCGSLRLGTLAVPYLDPGHYFGTDINQALLDSGYDLEILDKSRMDRAQLVVDPDFSFPGIPATVDFAMACSVFTHLPLNHLRRCLVNLRSKASSLRAFYFTVFVAPSAKLSVHPVEQAGGIFTHDIRDPYHCLEEEVALIGAQCGFSTEMCDWNHPRNQKMVIARPL